MQHATQQIAQLEQQKLQLEKQILVAQKTQQQLAAAAAVPVTPGKSIPALMSQRIAMPGVDQEHMNTPPPSQTHDAHPHAQAPGNSIYANYQQQQPAPQQPVNPFGDPRAANFFIPDMSKPPPGFPAPPQQSPQQQQQQQPPATAQYAAVGAEPPVDLGVLNAAIQAVMQLQHQHQQQRHPDEQQQLQQQVQQQQQQQQQTAAAYGVDTGVDLGALNAAIHVVLQQRPAAEQEESTKQHSVDDRLDACTAESGASSMPAQEPQVPTAPYYDLPAGLIVPLIRLEDYNYKPLDPSDIRLPPPAPQSERLTNALNAFYAAPSHDRPRDK